MLLKQFHCISLKLLYRSDETWIQGILYYDSTYVHMELYLQQNKKIPWT